MVLPLSLSFLISLGELFSLSFCVWLGSISLISIPLLVLISCLFLLSVSSADMAFERWQRMQESLNDMAKQHASTIDSHVRLVIILENKRLTAALDG